MLFDCVSYLIAEFLGGLDAPQTKTFLGSLDAVLHLWREAIISLFAKHPIQMSSLMSM